MYVCVTKLILFMILTTFSRFVDPEQLENVEKQQNVEGTLSVGVNTSAEAFDGTSQWVSHHTENSTKNMDDGSAIESELFRQRNKNITAISRQLEIVTTLNNMTLSYQSNISENNNNNGLKSPVSYLKFESITEISQPAYYDENFFYQPQYKRYTLSGTDFSPTTQISKTMKFSMVPIYYNLSVQLNEAMVLDTESVAYNISTPTKTTIFVPITKLNNEFSNSDDTNNNNTIPSKFGFSNISSIPSAEETQILTANKVLTSEQKNEDSRLATIYQWHQALSESHEVTNIQSKYETKDLTVQVVNMTEWKTPKTDIFKTEFLPQILTKDHKLNEKWIIAETTLIENETVSSQQSKFHQLFTPMINESLLRISDGPPTTSQTNLIHNTTNAAPYLIEGYKSVQLFKTPLTQNQTLNPHELVENTESEEAQHTRYALMNNLMITKNYVANIPLEQTNIINLSLHLNPIFKYGVRQTIVFSLEKMPNITARLSLSSSDYLIDFFILYFSDIDSKRKWNYTQFLGKELLNAGLRETTSLPFQSGYFRVVWATFWKIGDQELKLALTDSIDISHNYVMKTRHINIVGKHRLMCYPKISVLDCGEPEKPKVIVLNEVMHFVVQVDEYCGTETHGLVHWNLYDIDETGLLKHLGKSKNFQLYTKFDSSIVRSENPVLLLRVETIIRSIFSVARCYLFVNPPNLFPIIIGGSKNLISKRKAAILDGSLSEDYSTPNKSVKAENMEWYCISFNDPKNSFCKNLHKSAKKLRIPAYTLRLGKTYEIFLRIRSKLFPFITKVTRQTLQVIDDVVYTPHIICRDNCELGQYNPDRSVHLEAQCVDCPIRKRVSFEWFLNNEPYNFLMKSGSPQHFISHLTKSNESSHKILLKMKVGRKSYQNAINLIVRQTPEVKFCHVVKEYVLNAWEKFERATPLLFNYWNPDNYYEIMSKGPEASYTYQFDCWWDQIGNPSEDICVLTCISPPRPEGIRKSYIWDPNYQYPFDYRIETVGPPNVPVIGERSDRPASFRLPATKQIKIIICNSKDLCVTKTVDINVTPIELDSTLSSFKKFLRNWRHSTDLKGTLILNNWQAGFIIAHTAAKKTDSCELLEFLYSQMSDYQTTSKIQLEQMMFLINTLLTSLRDSIDYRCANIFAKYFLTTAINMEILTTSKAKIKRRHYNYIENTLLNATASFSNAREKLMRAMCKPSDYSCNKGRDDSEYYKDFGILDPKIAMKITSWLRCATNLVRNIHMFGVLAVDNLPYKDYPIKRSKQNVYMILHKLQKKPTRHLEIESLDGLTKIYISRKLIAELKDKLSSKTIIMQLVTQPNEDGLFWWYPQPVPMSSSVLIVHALRAGLTWSERVIQINNSIVFDTNATKTYNVSDDSIMSGTLTSRLHIQTYKLTVAPGAILVFSVVNNTNSMLVLMRLHRPPSGQEVNRHGCRVQANSTLKRIRMSNNCNSETNVFISIMPPYLSMARTDSEEQQIGSDIKLEQPLNYSFTLEIYECTVWINETRNPGWAPKYCVTIVDPDSEYIMRCSCNALGAFSPRIYSAFARLQADKVLETVLPINWFLILFYLLLLILLLYVLFSYMGSVKAHEKETILSCHHVVKKDRKVTHGESVVVVIGTGGKENAGTSANISLHFKSIGVPEVVYDVKQDPEHPKLKKNSSCTLKLGVDAVKLPTKLRILIDHQGRYPSWYCRNIIIHDLKRDSSQLFKIKRWIRDGGTEWIESDYYSTPRQYVEPYSWTQRMRNTFEDNFVNWFLLQPILGPWLSSNNTNTMNRYERTCVWICKFSACVAIAAFYFGATSYESHNIEKQLDNVYALNVITVLIVAVLCYLGCIAYDFIFHVIVMRVILHRY